MLPLFGLASVPMWLTPWASLLITSLLVPKARWVGGTSRLGRRAVPRSAQPLHRCIARAAIGCCCPWWRQAGAGTDVMFSYVCIPPPNPPTHSATLPAPSRQLHRPPGGHPGGLCCCLWPPQLAVTLLDRLSRGLGGAAHRPRRGTHPAAHHPVHPPAGRSGRLATAGRRRQQQQRRRGGRGKRRGRRATGGKDVTRCPRCLACRKSCTPPPFDATNQRLTSAEAAMKAGWQAPQPPCKHVAAPAAIACVSCPTAASPAAACPQAGAAPAGPPGCPRAQAGPAARRTMPAGC